jgi:hypothetical protein
VYLGVVRHGQFRKENAHPAILSQELFDAANAARTVQPVPPGDTTKDRLLIGIARCRGCGRTLKTVRRKRADGSYVVSYYCKNAASQPCPERTFVHADELDAFVADWFAAALRNVPRMVDVVAASRDLEQAQAKLAKAQTQLNAYNETADAIDKVRFLQGFDARQRRVDEATERVRQLSARLRRLPTGGPLIALWENFDVLERRDVLAKLLAVVDVARGAHGNLAGNVRILWADGTVAQDEARVRVAAA